MGENHTEDAIQTAMGKIYRISLRTRHNSMVGNIFYIPSSPSIFLFFLWFPVVHFLHL